MTTPTAKTFLFLDRRTLEPVYVCVAEDEQTAVARAIALGKIRCKAYIQELDQCQN